MTKTYILNFLKINRQELFEKFGVIKIGLFSSYATAVTVHIVLVNPVP